MLQSIFFDFNGVIIDDEPLQMKAYQESLQKLGITLTTEQYYGALGTDDRAFVGAVFEREAKELSEHDRQSIIERKSELHRELIKDELPLFPGVVTFLKAASRRYALGLVSMARRKEIDYVLERARLGELFTVIISAEDAPPGIESACAVGMRTIGVTNTVSENELRAARADVVTRSLADWTMDAVHHLFDE
jgi:beta-phosphoglucomutase-like phosphatase (HAD superfamily)